MAPPKKKKAPAKKKAVAKKAPAKKAVAKKAAPKAPVRRTPAVAARFTKTQMIAEIAETTELAKSKFQLYLMS